VNFVTPEKIDAILTRLRNKARRQKEAVEQTEAEIEHWNDQLDAFDKKGSPPKK